MIEITPEYLASQGLSANFPSRFFAKVQITPSCWFWMGNRKANGTAYGYACRAVWKNGSKTILAHRASWILHFGPIPKGLFVCHDCPDGDCPWCVNPAHLWLGTNSENIRDMWKKGRANPCGGIYYSGEQNRAAKLTNKQAEEIRRLYIPYIVPASSLARRFGIAKPGILKIIHGVSYKSE